ncbi:MAG: 16S rRNA (cytosine(1402)-N(4))-methyltransferase RsmH [Patescibacteria group bacterium]
MIHKPVLLKEILEYFNPKDGDLFIDGTANGGGHTLALWNMIKPTGRVLAIDKDSKIVSSLKKKVEEGAFDINVVSGSYADIKNIVNQKDFGNVSGILLDLGYSSYHIDESGRGFSFQKDEPLIMRYESDVKIGKDLTAYEVINSFQENEIADILYKYGEERFSRKIAKRIILKRREKKIESSLELAEVIASVFPKRHFKINPATKSFQALRIFVNNELADLENFLPNMRDILKVGGRVAIISFHSLEDRIVKNFFRDNKDKFKIITKKPLVPQYEEIRENPRARSAKLRIAEKI